MSYDPDTKHFCGICSIRLRGWEYKNVNRLQEVVPALECPPAVRVADDGSVPLSPITLRANHAWNGTAKLAWTGDYVEMYSDALGTTQITTGEASASGTDVAIDGLKVYAKGVKVTAKSGVMKLKATFVGAENTFKPETLEVKFMTVEAASLGLDLYDPLPVDTDDADYPAPLSDTDKTTQGTIIQVQRADRSCERCCVVVRRANPVKFSGELVVESVDDRLAIFEDRDPKSAAVGASVLKKKGKEIDADGWVLWVEGRKPSAALRDTGIRLRLGEGGEIVDEVKITVAQIGLVLTVAPTPVKTDRSAYAPPAWPNARPTFEIAAKPDAGKDWKPDETVVLVASSVPKGDARQPETVIKLVVTPAAVAAELDVGAWAAERGPDDAAGVKTRLSPLPTLTPDGADLQKATLDLDAVGSFYIKKTWNWKRNTDLKIESHVNLVLVLAEKVKSAHHTGRKCHTEANRHSSGMAIELHGGLFAGDEALAGVVLDTTLLVVGGGPDGKRGTDKVAVSWIQNIVAPRHTVGRSGVRTAHFVDETDPTITADVHQVFLQGKGGFDLLPGDVRAVFCNYPIVDKSLSKTNNDWGASFLGLSENKTTQTPKPLGIEWQQTAADSPSATASFRHPNPAKATLLLDSVDWELCFRAYLCVFSTAVDRVIAVVEAVDWDVLQTVQLDWKKATKPDGTGVAPKLPKVKVTPTPIAPADGGIGALTAAASTDLETGGPGPHNAGADDART